MIFKANILGAFIGAVLLLSVQAKLSHPIVSVQNLGADKQQRLRLQDVVASSSSSSSSDTHHKLTSTNLIVDLIADLAPHGMLPLSYGLAKGGLTGIVPAIALMISFGSLSAYTMTTYASLSQQTNAKSISEVWGAIIGNDTKWMADTILLSLCFGCCVFYSAFMGDIFGALSSASGFTGLLGDRSVVLSIVTVLAVLPLCLMEDLSGLAPTAAVGVGGILYTTLFTIKRCFDGTYINAEPYLGTMGQSAQPVFSDKLGLWNFNIGGALVLVNLLGVAFLAHYNAITYYNELENATPERFKKAVYTGWTIVLGIFTSTMFAGYKLFGDTAQPLLLNNFHVTKDALAGLARFCIGLAITFAYPLMFVGLKNSIFALFPSIFSKVETSKNNLTRNGITKGSKQARTGAIVSVIGLITAIAMNCGEEDVSFVLGIVGSVLGCGVAYVLPGYLNMKQMRIRKAKGLKNEGKDVLLSHVAVLVGLVFGSLGAYMTIAEKFA